MRLLRDMIIPDCHLEAVEASALRTPLNEGSMYYLHQPLICSLVNIAERRDDRIE